MTGWEEASGAVTAAGRPSARSGAWPAPVPPSLLPTCPAPVVPPVPAAAFRLQRQPTLPMPPPVFQVRCEGGYMEVDRVCCGK